MSDKHAADSSEFCGLSPQPVVVCSASFYFLIAIQSVLFATSVVSCLLFSQHTLIHTL